MNLQRAALLRRTMTTQDLRRAFSSAAASVDPSYQSEMTLEDVNKLHRLQTEFEKDPQNV